MSCCSKGGLYERKQGTLGVTSAETEYKSCASKTGWFSRFATVLSVPSFVSGREGIEHGSVVWVACGMMSFGLNRNSVRPPHRRQEIERSCHHGLRLCKMVTFDIGNVHCQRIDVKRRRYKFPRSKSANGTRGEAPRVSRSGEERWSGMTIQGVGGCNGWVETATIQTPKTNLGETTLFRCHFLERTTPKRYFTICRLFSQQTWFFFIMCTRFRILSAPNAAGIVCFDPSQHLHNLHSPYPAAYRSPHALTSR